MVSDWGDDLKVLTSVISFVGVYAKTLLSKRLQFGPLQAKRITAGNQQFALEEKIKERYALRSYLFYPLYIIAFV